MIKLLSNTFFDFSALLSLNQNVTLSIGSSPALVTIDGMSSITEDKKRILVVDDDLNILKVFKSILEKEGYVVETADTGKEALKKIKKEKFDVWLIDVRLPDMEGTDLLKVSNSEAIKIVVTGFSSDEVGRRAADYGADDFLVKPVKPEELIATVRERLCTV